MNKDKGAGGYDRLSHFHQWSLHRDIAADQRREMGWNPLWFWEDGDDAETLFGL